MHYLFNLNISVSKHLLKDTYRRIAIWIANLKKNKEEVIPTSR